MENNQFIKISNFLLTLGMLVASPLFVFAYSDETTHPGLTSETVKFFNLQYPNLKLSDAEKELLMKGSKEEDHGTRAMQHFYDPVYDRGIAIAGIEWKKSKDWAQDTLAQASYSLNFISNPTERIFYGTVREFFESDTDYSWDRAIYEYAWGDKERGLEALGHTVHLIQDASVPDHTRNDPHPPAFHFGSPFEQWTAQFGPENIDVVSKLRNKKPVQLSNLDEYFGSVANYSNNNFFSKDTIENTKYFSPNLESDGKYIRRAIGGARYEIAYDQRKIDFTKPNRQLEEGAYNLLDPDKIVLNNYWDLLSQQAVLHGTGVIKFFFDEVEKEKKTKVLYNKNKNWFQKFYDATQGKIFNVAAALYGSSVSFEELEELTGEAEVRKVPEEQSVSETALSLEETADTVLGEEQNVESAARPEEVAGQQAENQVTTEESSAIEPDVSTQNINEAESNGTPNPYSPGFGGGGSAPQNESSEDDEDVESEDEETQEEEPEAVSPPIVLSPVSSSSRIGTTTVTFSGTASTTLTVATNHSSATTSSDGSEDWSLTFSDLVEGENTFQFWTVDGNNATSTSVSKTITVDLTAPTVNSFSIAQCTYSLATITCLSGGGTANITWSSTASDISYGVIAKDGIVVATTSGSSYDLTLEDGTYSVVVGLYDGVGNAATSSAQSITVFANPIVINEIAWAGTEGSANDEWVELYNRSAYTIDLSRVSLVASDGVPVIALSGSATSSDYYLIERTSDVTTSISADLVTAFSGDGGGSGLGNDGEVLSLTHYAGGLATTTLDSTPALADCNGAWCAGTSDTNPRTMERVNVTTSGSIATNWQSNNTYTKNGTDANNGTINGTPASQNSVNLLSIGYYCPPYTATFVESGYYIPTSGLCTYLSSAITSGTRYGSIYRGTIASSTSVNVHSLGTSATSTQNNDNPSNPVQGEQFFTAIYRVRNGPAFDDVVDFGNYFKTGANPPPHLEYGVINWIYGTAP